ncbi:MAG: galactose mutarotase [Lentisphaerae bacterium]|nr:galactose mutarotase [Lentisphaerota bacterium]
MRITREPYGTTSDGQPVEAFILESTGGIRVTLINYGATIAAVEVPDRAGVQADVVLGFDDLAGYQSEANPYFGATCGRFANRIARGRFTLGGTEYTLACNDGPNSLHGGLVGFDKQVWAAMIVDSTVKMSLTSPDGDEGYPGTLRVEICFGLDEAGALRIDYQAESDQPTVLNLTNHSYFNLAGGGSILDHIACINADRYTVVDDRAIPTGELHSVAGNAMDLLSPIPIRRNITAVQGGGYDHNYCLNRSTAEALVLAAKVVEPVSGRSLECWTTEPGVQFYTGNFLHDIPGKRGARYNAHAGFCLETQHYPDSPNQPSFPSTVLAPGEAYRQACIYTFGVEG